MIVSGMRAVSALDASATARSKPATRWKRLIARRTNAGRSQNVSVRSTRSRSIRGLVSIRGGRSSSVARAAPRRCRRECRARSVLRPGGAHHLRRGCGRPGGGGAVGAPRWRPTPPLGSAHARAPGQGRIGRVTAALGWGALAASSLVIGALLGLARDVAGAARRPRARVRRGRADQRGQLRPRRGGRAARRHRRRRGRPRRRRAHLLRARPRGRRGASSAAAGGGAGTALALGALARRHPGAGGARHRASPSGEGVSVGLLVAIFVSNLPEAIGSSTDMRAAGHAARRRSAGCGSPSRVVCTLATVVGYAHRRQRLAATSRPRSTASPPARCS